VAVWFAAVTPDDIAVEIAGACDLLTGGHHREIAVRRAAQPLRRILEVGLIDYNTARPHSRPGWMSPTNYAAARRSAALHPPAVRLQFRVDRAIELGQRQVFKRDAPFAIYTLATRFI
jgi:hypothetical protein